MKDNYIDFLMSKMAISHQTGFDVELNEMTPSLYPHVKDSVKWAFKEGVELYSQALDYKRQ